MTAEDLQNGADWLYRKFYRLDRVLVLVLVAPALLSAGVGAAALAFRLNRTYRYDIRREHIVGRKPARAARAEKGAHATQASCLAGPRAAEAG